MEIQPLSEARGETVPGSMLPLYRKRRSRLKRCMIWGPILRLWALRAETPTISKGALMRRATKAQHNRVKTIDLNRVLRLCSAKYRFKAVTSLNSSPVTSLNSSSTFTVSTSPDIIRIRSILPERRLLKLPAPVVWECSTFGVAHLHLR